MYHDMAQQFCVQYYPPQSLEEPDFLRKFNPDASIHLTGLPAIKGAHYITAPHVVFDMNEMIRYILFRDRLAELKASQ